MRPKSVGEEPIPDSHTCWMRSPQPICSAFPRPRSTGGLHSETRAPMSALPAMRCLSACADGTPTSCANGSARYAGRWRAPFRAVSESGSRLTGPRGGKSVISYVAGQLGRAGWKRRPRSSLREARAFKAERDAEASSGGRRHDPRLRRAPLSRVGTSLPWSSSRPYQPKPGRGTSSIGS